MILVVSVDWMIFSHVIVDLLSIGQHVACFKYDSLSFLKAEIRIFLSKFACKQFFRPLIYRVVFLLNVNCVLLIVINC